MVAIGTSGNFLISEAELREAARQPHESVLDRAIAAAVLEKDRPRA
jgi:hypothetical protein